MKVIQIVQRDTDDLLLALTDDGTIHVGEFFIPDSERCKPSQAWDFRWIKQLQPISVDRKDAS